MKVSKMVTTGLLLASGLAIALLVGGFMADWNAFAPPAALAGAVPTAVPAQGKHMLEWGVFAVAVGQLAGMIGTALCQVRLGRVERINGKAGALSEGELLPAYEKYRRPVVAEKRAAGYVRNNGAA